MALTVQINCKSIAFVIYKCPTIIKTVCSCLQGRWYHRKQAVKELHCTLIRLLNELLPWEPKLMKAFQRNR